jgi:hypothetical protein
MARLAPSSIEVHTDYSLPRKAWIASEQAQLDAAAEEAKRVSPGGLVGETVRWPRADGYAVYMIVRQEPLMLAHVNICDGYSIESALIRGLTLTDVRKMVERERALRHFFEHTNDFYDELEVGQVVHYHNGFKEFVRCEVVEAPDDDACVHAEKGERCLRPVALVGGWGTHDLRSDGYHMKGVREGRLFKPNASCIYENPEATQVRRHEDPAQLEPLGIRGQQEMFG